VQQMHMRTASGSFAPPHAVAPGVRTLIKQAASRLDMMAELLRCPITRVRTLCHAVPRAANL
jgi:hypothetical protein